ncbi:tumor necrosis factor receptor superfamily member 18-like [Podarcis raffonei]|uniref:tumor necrosis factor receptor superfamily member 18-like n=1 Tax=Podarcis raffonei TaxID=65483 RepID=UPI0023295DCD|nr:tumor necrosis factor receptor superfamily member 18-like [Podarcis raffonei]
MEAKFHPRLDGRWICLAMLWLCVELAQSTIDGQQEGRPCCSSTLAGIPPKSCGKCGGGKCCKDKLCHQCRALPTCPEGQELRCSGTIDFRYFCSPCPNGTFSDAKGSCCRPWANCKTLGLPVRRPGNTTHNVECGDTRPITVVMQIDSTVTTILTIVTATGLSLLILLTFFLIICVWTQKKKVPLVEEPESVHPSNFLGSHHEDTCSCQFPEEEHGENMDKWKASQISLAH